MEQEPILNGKKDYLDRFRSVPFLKKNGKFILVDSFSMKPNWKEREFDNAFIISDVCIKVEISNKFGLVDMNGNEIVPISYERDGHFLLSRKRDAEPQ